MQRGVPYIAEILPSMVFDNSVQSIDALPEVSAEDFEGMPARYRVLRWGVFASVTGLAGLIFGAAIWWISEGEGEEVPGVIWGLVAAAAGSLALWAMEEAKGFSVRGVLVRTHDLTFRSGFWVYEEITVPFNRIQHSEVSQGPLSRAFRLCTLKLYTAGSSGANLRVPGMDVERAQRLRALLDERAGKS